jgi:DNA-binding response OmpR family regulator
MSPRISPPVVLLVEDRRVPGEQLVELLTSCGHRVEWAQSSAAAAQLLERSYPDAAVVDLLVPDLDRRGLFSRLDRISPVLIIVSESTGPLQGKIVSHPNAQGIGVVTLQPRELATRVFQALSTTHELRRAMDASDCLRFGNLTIERSRSRATVDGRLLRLTPTEYWLLLALARRADQVVSRDELAQAVLGSRAARGQPLTMHIARLRARLADANPGAPTIEAVRGVGYRLSLVCSAVESKVLAHDATQAVRRRPLRTKRFAFSGELLP